MNYITVDEFKSWNPELDFSGVDDVVISGMISRASAWVDKYLGYSPMAEDINDELTPAMASTDFDLLVFPRKIPIISVSGIKLKLGTYETDLVLEDADGNKTYDIPEPRYHIVFPFLELQTMGKAVFKNLVQVRQRTYFVKLSYRAGYETLPDDIKDAVNLATKDIFIRQKNPLGVSSVSEGGISISFRSDESQFLAEAKRLLEPYVRRY
jgi:hypothetical protein